MVIFVVILMIDMLESDKYQNKRIMMNWKTYSLLKALKKERIWSLRDD